MFKILLTIDALAALTVGYFFVAGLTDGSVSAFNIQLWVVVLIAIAAIIFGGVVLRNSSKPVLANIVLAILAIPVVLYGIFILAVVMTGTRWN